MVPLVEIDLERLDIGKLAQRFGQFRLPKPTGAVDQHRQDSAALLFQRDRQLPVDPILGIVDAPFSGLVAAGPCLADDRNDHLGETKRVVDLMRPCIATLNGVGIDENLRRLQMGLQLEPQCKRGGGGIGAPVAQEDQIADQTSLLGRRHCYSFRQRHWPGAEHSSSIPPAKQVLPPDAGCLADVQSPLPLPSKAAWRRRKLALTVVLEAFRSRTAPDR